MKGKILKPTEMLNIKPWEGKGVEQRPIGEKACPIKLAPMKLGSLKHRGFIGRTRGGEGEGARDEKARERRWRKWYVPTRACGSTLDLTSGIMKCDPSVIGLHKAG